MENFTFHLLADQISNCQKSHFCQFFLNQANLKIVTKNAKLSNLDNMLYNHKEKQAGAELCQAQHSWLSYQPAVAGARSLAKLQLRIYGQKGLFRWMKYKLRLAGDVY